MADLVFNIAKGRVAEFYNRVDQNDPTNSALVVIAIVSADTDDAIRDVDSVSALLALSSTDEATNTNYARKVLTDTDLSALAPDDTNNRIDLDFADQVWSLVGSGDNWTDLVIAYDPDSTGGTDADLIPLTLHDFSVTPDGSDITAQLATAGFYRAS
jgi:hypothetical protein